MKYLKKYKIFESVNRKFVSDFLLDFGFMITMKFSQITKMDIDAVIFNSDQIVKILH
jgi:hypothetical protein